MRIDRANFKIKMEITGEVTRRWRRATLLAIFKRIAPIFELIEPGSAAFAQGSLVHEDGSEENMIRDLDRGIRLHQASDTETEVQKSGFEIRAKRLKKGLSQAELADGIDMSRGNLSEIERGRHKARPSTLFRIHGYLDSLSDKPTNDPRKSPGQAPLDVHSEAMLWWAKRNLMTEEELKNEFIT